MAGRIILIVEDDIEVRECIADDVTKMVAGSTVLLAGDGVEAIKIMEQTKPDVILSDWAMPNMNGHEFCIKVREDERFKDVPIILISGAMNVGEFDNDWDVNLSGIVVKPYYARTLLPELRKVLSEL